MSLKNSINYVFKGLVTRVIDGDTFDADVDCGFDITVNKRFRLKGIDTPETWRPKTDAEKKHGEEAKALAIKLIEGRRVTLRSVKSSVYNRYEADVELPDGSDLCYILIEAGFEKRDNYPENTK